MIVFLEGFPGAGKTYSAVKDYLLPQVEKGGRVVTNIKGINHEAISELLKLPLQTVVDLVTHIQWDDTLRMDELCGNDALVIIDEVQDFWPSMSKMSAAHTAFITQHRQRGLELVIMGQDLKDCHATWKRRVNRKIVYLNRDAIGKPKEALWTAYQAKQDTLKGQTTWEKVEDGKVLYEPKYWNCYKSHVDGVENKDRPKDDRFNVLKTKAFTFWIPVAVIAALYAIYYLYGFLHDPHKITNVPLKVTAERPINSPSTQANHALPKVLPKGIVPSKPEVPFDYIQELLSKYRPRLAALIVSHDKVDALIEFLDSGYRAQERLKLSDLQNMGWKFTIKGEILTISKNDKTVVITAWPIDPFGAVANKVSNSPAVSGKPS